MRREQAIESLEKLGANYTVVVNRNTDILVVGHVQTSLFSDDSRTKKIKNAEKLLASESSLYVMEEAEFLTLIGVFK